MQTQNHLTEKNHWTLLDTPFKHITIFKIRYLVPILITDLYVFRALIWTGIIVTDILKQQNAKKSKKFAKKAPFWLFYW